MLQPVGAGLDVEQEVTGGVGEGAQTGPEQHQRTGHPGLAGIARVVIVQIVVDVAVEGEERLAEVRHVPHHADLGLQRGPRVVARGILAPARRGELDGHALDPRQQRRRDRPVGPVPRGGAVLEVDGEGRRNRAAGLVDQGDALVGAAVVPGDVAGGIAPHLAHQHVVVRVRRAPRVHAVGVGDVAGVHRAVVVDVESPADDLGSGLVADRGRPRRAVQRGRLEPARRVVRQRRLVHRGGVGVGLEVGAEEHLRRVDVGDRRLRERGPVEVRPVARAAQVLGDEVERGAHRLDGLHLVRGGRLAARRGVHHRHERDHDDTEHDQGDHQLDHGETGRGGTRPASAAESFDALAHVIASRT